MSFTSLHHFIQNPQETLHGHGEDITCRACEEDLCKTYVSSMPVSTISVFRQHTHLSEKAPVENEYEVT